MTVSKLVSEVSTRVQRCTDLVERWRDGGEPLDGPFLDELREVLRGLEGLLEAELRALKAQENRSPHTRCPC